MSKELTENAAGKVRLELELQPRIIMMLSASFGLEMLIYKAGRVLGLFWHGLMRLGLFVEYFGLILVVPSIVNYLGPHGFILSYYFRFSLRDSD